MMYIKGAYFVCVCPMGKGDKGDKEEGDAILAAECFVDDYSRGYWSEFTGVYVLEVCQNLLMSLPPGEYDNTSRAGLAWMGVVRVYNLVRNTSDSSFGSREM